MPAILPETVYELYRGVPERLILALSSDVLPCEEAGGWLITQQQQQQRSSSSMRNDVRRLKKFMGWLDISLKRFGLEHLRPRMSVSYGSFCSR